MRNLWIVLALLAGLFAANSAQAKPEYLEILTTVYKPYANALSDRSCANCHVSASDYGLNPFGKQIAHELVAANTKELTAAILQKVEALDADQDGTSNLDEIKAGTNPADAKSGGKPGFKPPPSATAGAESSAPPRAKSLIPKNAFHPAIVHFPIALFITGLLLDFIGWRRQQQSFLLAGWYNLVLGALSTIASVASGLLAIWRMHLKFEGLIFNHLLLACIGSAIMWGMVALRVHRHEKMNVPLRAVYYVFAVAALLLISYSAHLGGAFVYGE